MAKGRGLFVRTFAGGIAGLVALAACQSDARPERAGDVTLFLRQVNVDHYDYDPLASPKALSENATLVIRGNLSDVVAGRAFAEPGTSELGLVTGVFQVRVGDVLAGELPADSDNTVYVEHLGIQQPEALSSSAPQDAEVLLFLIPASKESLVPGTQVVDEGTGVASDQPLFHQVNPQGFYMDVGSDVTQVFGGEVYLDSSLDEFLPGNDEFPSEPVPFEEALRP